ncbi:SusC/RagA family TonB-linked outer membrane protein [Rubrivirga sp. S365]|uniref:SusC/RagA family TonB-linked outer membrane protein n=1 Tax=Rubrivirga litoralis TaxID=3075598 RepID=A0ABU3BRE6_9BACT|nr:MULTISPECIES: SusC/RagA family TonB-linked outer membrane protein [unclassified Rubrivirga]MDT0631859.1 SusC/RagA family TonB-linked outer membrane protein [Rubrivirga sp. F394]MDT7857912.1 SusC/RagA family TonB-linked outer membrane protein [Rubrivirga sp. S365]
MILSTNRAALVVAFVLLPALASAQTVSGTVTDASSGQPIPGATVVVLASTIGVRTDVDGGYEIELPPGQRRLEYSFVGYRTETVTVEPGQTVVDVALEEDLLGLDEVVVTGLGTSVKRSNSAISVETISARELSEVTTPQTLDGALNGKITGAVVNSNSGAPGGGINIRLRGITTINGNSQPLYVVDGVIVSNDAVSNGTNAVSEASGGGNASSQDNPVSRIADLPAEDIESIEVLKGPSAAAIYGARASNGVVVIRTKSGAAGRTEVSLSQTVGVASIQRTLGSRQFTAATAEATYGPAGLAAFNAAGGRTFDLEEELFGNDGLLLTTNLSVSGGNDRTQFYVSGIVKDDEGIVAGTGYEKQSGRINLTHRLSDLFEVDANANYVRSVANRGITGNDNSGATFGVGLLATPSFVDLRPGADGEFPDNPFNAANPLQTRDLATIEETNNRFFGSGKATVNLLTSATQSLQLIGVGGVDYYALDQANLFPVQLQFEPDDELPGTSSLGRTTNLNTNVQLLAVHAYAPEGRDLSFTTQAGLTAFDQEFDNVLTVSRGLIPDQQNLNLASSIQTNQNRFFQNDRALFAQEEVSYRDAVIATAGLRVERSSANGDVSDYYAYPKAGLALNLTNLGVLEGGAVDLFKLRAAFGQTGNTAPFGSKFTTFGTSTIASNAGLVLEGRRGFAGIEPERATEFEGGLDLTLFGGRVNLEATAYTKVVDNLILDRQVEPSSGFTIETFNGGQLRNNGVELGLSLVPVSTDLVQWISRTSFWANDAEITELTVPPFQAIGGGFGNTLGSIRIEEGRSPTQIVGTDEDGEVVALGDVSPDFQMSFFNDIAIARRLRLTVFGHWKKGGDNINLTELLSDLLGTSPDFDEDNDGDGTADGLQRLDASGARRFVQNASYFKLREVGLYYDVAPSLFGPLAGGLRTLRVGVSANNLFTITPYKSYDPEVSNFGSSPVASGVEVAPFPSSRTFNVHVRVGL